MMTIRPSTALRNDYGEISRLCRESDEPVFITRNGEGDLVVQSLAAYNRREASLELREKLLEAEEQLASGVQPVPLEQAAGKWSCRQPAKYSWAAGSWMRSCWKKACPFLRMKRHCVLFLPKVTPGTVTANSQPAV